MEVKKKKSETTLRHTETNESHPKFMEIQKQIQCLTTETKHLKTCNTLSNHITTNHPKSLNKPQDKTFFTATNLQPSKNSQGASAEDRGVTKQEVKEVLNFKQNTMQTLTVFEKQFNNQ